MTNDHQESYKGVRTVGGAADALAFVVESVIKPVVRSKLHVSLREDDTRERNQDAIELIGDVRLGLLSELSRSSNANGGIEDLSAYAATVAANSCYQYLRERFPNRTRLRNKLRYLLTHNQKFALWKDADRAWLCGLATWCGRSDRGALVPDPEALFGDGIGSSLNVDSIIAIFEQAGAPVLFDELVDHAALLFGISERYEISKDSDEFRDRIASPEILADAMIELRSKTAELWSRILKLSPKHRKVLLLNLRDGSGDNLLAALPIAGVATIREIAAALEIPIEEFAGMWNSLPMNDMQIADLMGMTRQQVINLRQSARAKLLRWNREAGNI